MKNREKNLCAEIRKGLRSLSPAYCSKNVRGKVYSECNRDIQKWFRVNSRNNIPRKRFDEACEYIQRWRPSVNTSMIIRQTNQQTKIYE